MSAWTCKYEVSSGEEIPLRRNGVSFGTIVLDGFEAELVEDRTQSAGFHVKGLFFGSEATGIAELTCGSLNPVEKLVFEYVAGDLEGRLGKWFAEQRLSGHDWQDHVAEAA